jgi:hypothetical protein
MLVEHQLVLVAEESELGKSSMDVAKSSDGVAMSCYVGCVEIDLEYSEVQVVH